tara:strand:+ start:53 stop:721 length:669 start_codon:yes stop_codon:yes gene_type:complete
MAIRHNQRSIVDFRSRLKGGGARSNLFEVQMAFPDFAKPVNEALNDIPFLVKAAEIPASNIGNIPVPFRGRVLPIAGDRTFDPWTVTIINDTNFRLRDVMERWSDGINDIQTAQGTTNPEEYQTQAKVLQLSRGIDTNGKVRSNSNIPILREYDFIGIYPNVVSSIPLDHGATDQIEEFQVTFNYLYYEVRGKDDKTGTNLIDKGETNSAGGGNIPLVGDVT